MGQASITVCKYFEPSSKDVNLLRKQLHLDGSRYQSDDQPWLRFVYMSRYLTRARAPQIFVAQDCHTCPTTILTPPFYTEREREREIERERILFCKLIIYINKMWRIWCFIVAAAINPEDLAVCLSWHQLGFQSLAGLTKHFKYQPQKYKNPYKSSLHNRNPHASVRRCTFTEFLENVLPTHRRMWRVINLLQFYNKKP